MRGLIWVAALFAVLSGDVHFVARCAAAYEDDVQPAKATAEALATIDAAFQTSQTQQPTEQIVTLRAAVSDVSARLAENVLIAEALNSALDDSQRAEAASKPRVAVDSLRSGLSEAREILRFRIVDEGPQPEGFPAITPVGEIRVKQYPAYRLARAKSTGDNAFWTLFRHIQKNDIAMTAPVKMTYGTGATKAAPEGKAEAPAPRQVDMAFLYRNKEQGKLGADGAVDVSEVAPVLAVSIGLRGPSGEKQLAAARAHLERWLTKHSAEYQAAGPLRMMGFNSPMVVGKRRYYEVEIPVRDIREADAEKGKAP